MNKLNLNLRLFISFLILLAGTLISVNYLNEKRELRFSDRMEDAVELTNTWFTLIKELKEENNISSDTQSGVPNSFMIGDEWSEITSSLGSLEAKETSTNPDFAALIVRLLLEAGIKEGDRAGVILSGSFPSLAIAAFAALQTLDLDAVVMSSLGASTYGANQPEVTWIDMEKRLIEKGKMEYHSDIISMGAGRDNGYGLSEEGLLMMMKAANRNGVSLYIPSTLEESIKKKVDLFSEKEISILINIGGNESAIGACSHALDIPNGFSSEIIRCSDHDRGVVSRMNELGVPLINMLNIKDLASQYGIAVSPGIDYSESLNLYTESKSNRTLMIIVLLTSLIPFYFLRIGKRT